MGLGKTVQALALIVARPSSDRTCRTTLIIAPVALMRQWEKEIQRHINDSHRLKVHVYHGSGKNADFNKLRQFDVVLTTFGTLGSEFKQKEKRREAEFVQREQRDPAFRRKVKDKLALIGPECMWYRIIIDEAQCIKNKNTQVSKASAELQARHRLVMTGTPMMNSIDELYPLIRFLQIKPYNDQMRFSLHFSKMIKEERSREKGMQRVQALLKSIMLRRQKTSTIDGEQICKIPPKHTHQDAVEFTDDESELYKAIEGKTQLRFNKYLKAGTVTKNYAYILVLLLRLRQACCHPHLIKDLGVQVSTEGIDEVDLLERAKLLEPDAVGRIKAADAFECGICMDAVVNPTLFIPCGHDCCGECFQKLVDPTKAIREGNENNGPSCHICRGPLSSQKITDYRHFCKVFAPEKGTQVFGEEVNEDEGAGSESESESESADSDDDDDDDLDGFVVPDDVEDDFEPPVPQKSSSEKSKKSKQSSKAKGKAPAKTKTTLAQLKQESLKNKAAKRKYLRRLRKDWITSSKIEKTLQLVSEIGANDPTEKILIFSQFTSLLDLLEVPLHERGVKYQRYDGSMKMDDRAEAVNRFMDEADQQLMLISLKAGNAGLNLNKASQVIILDPFWNPFIEDQAVDRAHRMPQQREVHVHRVLVPQTVEDRICELQDKKRDLINSALDENAGKSISRLGVSELMYLFGMRERPDDRAN
jgi:SNF2 family DNA or RNA helicase